LQCLRELKDLLEKCAIVITVVTKTEEEEMAMQWNPNPAMAACSSCALVSQ